ncbi:MAG: serine peptidase [Porticoccaceae bacterium]|nr:serine peptidase [Porticoccaceae bacterium]
MLVKFHLTVLLTFITLTKSVASLPDFTELVDKVAPAVVKINVSFAGESQLKSQPYGGNLPDIFRELLEQQRNLRERPDRASLGSGFVISSDGYIITNHHVVDRATKIRVSFADRREFDAEMVGTDRRSDLALLKINGSDLPTLEFATENSLRVGAWVLAIGSPFGLDYSVTAGIVSAMGRSIPTDRNENYVPFIQTDVAINPGNSGGPLFDLSGKVVGINSQIYSRTGGSIGLSFAIPAQLALDVVQQLKSTGRVDRGWLGVAIQDVDQKLARSLNLKEAKGALVSAVEIDSPADLGKIMPGDVIISFNRQAVIESSDLPPLVGQVAPGARVPVKIMRDGKVKKLNIIVAALDGDQSTSEQVSKANENGDRLGLRVGDVEKLSTSDDLINGVVIQYITPRSAADIAGLRQGDVIVQLGQVRILNFTQYNKVVKEMPKNRPVAIRFLRRGTAVFRTIEIND